MTTKKYRPYLSKDELTIILDSLKARPLYSTLPLITYLDGYLTDITRGTRQANMETKASFTETLHSTNEVSQSAQDQAITLFAKWSHFPASCSPAELEIVQNYRYLNNNMTEAEERDYEKSKGI